MLAFFLVATLLHGAPARGSDEHDTLYEPLHVGADANEGATRWQHVAPPRPEGCVVAPAGAGLEGFLGSVAEGAAVCLEAGRYPGNLRIERRVTLWGPQDAVIESTRIGTTIHVGAVGVRLLGFTIDGSGGRFDSVDAALRIAASGATVEGLTIKHATFGILAERVENVTVRGNDIVGDPALPFGLRGDGIRLWETRDSIVARNRLTDSRDTVIWYSRNNLIEDNVVVRGRYGTHFMYSHGNRVRRNRYVNEVVGVFIMYSRDVTLEDNLLAGSGGAAGIGVGLKESGNVRLWGNAFVRDTTGIYIDTSPLSEEDQNRFEGNVIRLSGSAVVFHGRATRNHFVDNSFRDNLAQVESRGGTNARDAEWLHNDFDDYAGYDLDGDGFGDVPYELHSLTANLVGHYPNLAWFRGGLALFAVDAVNHILPLFEPTILLVDARPRMRPVVGEAALRGTLDAD